MHFRGKPGRPWVSVTALSAVLMLGFRGRGRGGVGGWGGGAEKQAVRLQRDPA